MLNKQWRYYFLVLLMVLAVLSEPRRRKYRIKHKYKHEHEHERRKVRSHEDCRMHEEFVKCGPEAHCEMSCSNLFSPPNCMMSEVMLVKCWYPKCICKKGYVRSGKGRCIPEWKCEEFKEEGVLSPNRHRNDYPFIFGHPRQNNFW